MLVLKGHAGMSYLGPFLVALDIELHAQGEASRSMRHSSTTFDLAYVYIAGR
jgi:hypothetical protein